MFVDSAILNKNSDDVVEEKFKGDPSVLIAGEVDKYLDKLIVDGKKKDWD